MQFFEELHQYLLEDEGSWAIGDGFLTFVGEVNAVLAFRYLKQDLALGFSLCQSSCISQYVFTFVCIG